MLHFISWHASFLILRSFMSLLCSFSSPHLCLLVNRTLTGLRLLVSRQQRHTRRSDAAAPRVPCSSRAACSAASPGLHASGNSKRKSSLLWPARQRERGEDVLLRTALACTPVGA